MSTDAVGQTMEHGGDFQIALEHTNVAFDVGKDLLTLHDVFGSEVADIGQQHHVAARARGIRDGRFVDVAAEAIGLEVGLDVASEFCLCQCPLESRAGATITGSATALGLAQVLRIQCVPSARPSCVT